MSSMGSRFGPRPFPSSHYLLRMRGVHLKKMVIAAAMVLTASALIKLMYSRVLLTCKVGRTAWEGGKGWKCFGEASRLEAGGKVTPNPWEEGISLGLQAPTGFRACDGGNVCANCRPKGINLEIRRPGQD
jgi:hypothetical protein